jgi:serine/threonine-protein kinase
MCLVCQAPLPDDAQFCHRCGTGTPTDPGVPPRTASTGIHEVHQVRNALADRYRIERLLGEGGMAAVYLAEDLKHRRQVAVKVMRPELAATLGTDRFLREIEIAARLTHPHVLALLDSGAIESVSPAVLYYVMPYIEGETVRELLDREKQLPVADAVRLAREVAEGLGYAHDRGIIHRDIKPANILLSGRHALVADFGIARAVGGEGETLTRTGLSVGTPHYMAPEQAAGDREVDHRADIYAVAALLYEMIAGEPPFTGPTARAIITRSMTERPRPLSDVREGVHPALDAAVLRALSKAPADRPQTATEFAAELERAMDLARTPSAAVPAAVLPAAGPSPLVTWGLFAVGSLAGLALAWAAVRHWAMPVWVMAVALVLVLVGAGVMVATSLTERRRGEGLATSGLASRLTWRNAATGGLLALGLWSLLAAGLVLRGPSGSGRDGAIRLAVMPFVNRGAADDAYFVDGVADEVRGKLSQLAGFEVIAGGSTEQYRETSKTLTQIGTELGVDYLLTATVRRARGSDSVGRVQVTPELMDVRAGTVRWQERFDRADGEVLAVQSAIATRVAAALGVALSGSDADAVEERPTENLAAYDLFLKGQAAGRVSVPREAVSYFEQAVALDADFTKAWSNLVWSLATVYANGDRDPATAARARAALDRLAQVSPGSAEYHTAAAVYSSNVERDMVRAGAYVDSALRLTPNDPVILARSGAMDVTLGRTASGIEKLERARTLDPRSGRVLRSLMGVLFQTGRFAESREAAEAVAALGGEMLVSTWQVYALAYAAEGDLEGARAVVRRGLQDLPPTALVAQLAGVNETAWLLDEAEQQMLFRLPASAFEDDRAWWAQSLATAHWARGDRAAARAYADSGLAISREQADRSPADAQLRVLYALLLAYSGRGEEAIAEGRRALDLQTATPTLLIGSYLEIQMARIHLALNQPDEAIGYLERAVNHGFYTGRYLQLDPTYRSLHGNPRFDRLVAGA